MPKHNRPGYAQAAHNFMLPHFQDAIFPHVDRNSGVLDRKATEASVAALIAKFDQMGIPFENIRVSGAMAYRHAQASARVLPKHEEITPERIINA